MRGVLEGLVARDVWEGLDVQTHARGVGAPGRAGAAAGDGGHGGEAHLSVGDWRLQSNLCRGEREGCDCTAERGGCISIREGLY